MSDDPTLSLDEVHHLAERVLRAHGFSDAQGGAIAATVTAAERDGCTSHGLFRIPFYVAALKNESVDAGAEPTVAADDSAVVHVDGARGFCPLALDRGLPLLAEAARRHGIASLAIHEVYNIAALWPEVERLAGEGLVAFAFTASNACVAPAGGITPVYGTNPMAFGWPRASRPPMVFDQASSACARGEIQLHLREGKPLPEGWAIDARGEPTTDPTDALAGAQLPFGGHKGAAIALMVELLAGALIGELFSLESKARDVHRTGAPFGGEFLIAIDPARHVRGGAGSTGAGSGDPKSGSGSVPSPASHLERAETLFAAVLEQEGTRLPSDRRFAARKRTAAEGVRVAASLHATLDELARA